MKLFHQEMLPCSVGLISRVLCKKWVVELLLLCTLFLAASAQDLIGNVKNSTTNKPDGGDDVVLLSLGQGMEEAGRTQTDAKGNFTLKLDDATKPHLVRVIHQGVTYHRMAPPGTASVEVEVYDVSKKLEGITVTADVRRFQAQGSELQGICLFAVNNASDPPRTQMNDQNFEFYLPEGAQVDQSMAMTAGGQPINSAPVPQKEKDRYAFVFPLRPGETQFQVSYHLPYSGEASFNPKPLYGARHFVVVLPKSIQFTAATGTNFQAMNDPRQGDAVVQVASNTMAGDPLGFKISGTGLLAEPGDDSQGTPSPVSGAQTSGAAAGRDSRPGGGLGPPIDAPDPLEKYRWYILGGFALVLAGGAIYIVQQKKAVPDYGSSGIEVSESPFASKPRPAGSLLLEALKEEIFHLEVEHKQGHISQQEYEKAKAALDQTLERAVRRSAARAI